MASLNIHLRRFLDWFLALFSKGHLPDDVTPLRAPAPEAPKPEPKPLPPPPLELDSGPISDGHPVDADAITPPVVDLPLPSMREGGPDSFPIVALASPTSPLKPPFLIVDLYWQDQKNPNWSALVESQDTPLPVIAAIIKATQGTGYFDAAISWFHAQWGKLAKLPELRRGAYHFLNFNQSGISQAAYYMKTVGASSWKSPRVILPIVDVERGNEGSPNYKASASQIVDVTSDFIAYIKRELGLECILYGRGAMRDLSITSKMGAKWLWNPSYTAVMKASTITRIGWAVKDVCMWQYTDGDTALATTTTGVKLPKSIPGFGSEDTSVYLSGKSVEDFDKQLVALQR